MENLATVKVDHTYVQEQCGTLMGAAENLRQLVREQERAIANQVDIIKEQEATIQTLKERLPYWADQLEEYRYVKDPDDEQEFGKRIAEMRSTAEQL